MKHIKLLLLFFVSVIFIMSCKKTDDVRMFTVTFNSEGGMNIAAVRVKAGNKIPMDRLFPSPIIADGGKFGGWFADSELTKKFDFNNPIISNTIIYAKWNYVMHTVSFEMNGANHMDSIEVREGYPIQLSNPSWDKHVFVGWYGDSGLVKAYDMSTKVMKDITLYARWVEPSPSAWFTIDANGVLTSCTPPNGTEIVVIPNGVKFIPAWFVLANGLNEPGKPGFPTGKGISEFILPDSLEEIGIGAFKFAAIKSVIIPPKVKELTTSTFEGCDQLTQFAFAPNSELERLVSDDANEPVISSSSLEFISFPPSLQYVGKYTMNGCNALKTVTFERSGSPVVFYSFLPGGGVWLFGGYFPGSILMPAEVTGGFLSGIRSVMQDYEYNNWAQIVKGY